MTPLFVNLLTFFAVFLAVFAGNAILVDFQSGERKRLKKRLEERFRSRQKMRAHSSPLLKDFSQIAAEARSDNQAGQTFRQSVQFLIEQSGLELSMKRLCVLSASSGILCGVTIGFLLVNPLFAVIGLLVGALIPLLYVRFKRAQRLEELRAQAPDAFDLMARAMRAGQTISQAMQAVADEFSSPISLEFLYCYEQMNMGLSPDAALRELGRRTGLLEMKIFVLAVVVHRQAGGNLAELLDKLGHVVRERFRIRGMIRSLTAQGRFQAMILLSLPPFMFALLMLLHREYELVLLDYPLLIVLALTMMGTGAYWIRKIVNFDY